MGLRKWVLMKFLGPTPYEQMLREKMALRDQITEWDRLAARPDDGSPVILSMREDRLKQAQEKFLKELDMYWNYTMDWRNAHDNESS